MNDDTVKFSLSYPWTNVRNSAMQRTSLELTDLTLIAEHGKTPLAHAQERKNQALLDEYYLLAKEFYKKSHKDELDYISTDDPQHNRTILYWAIACMQDESIIDSLLTKGSCTEEQYRENGFNASSAFFTAFSIGNLDAMRSLLKHNPSLISTVNSYGSPPTHYAVQYDRTEILDVLYKQNSDITKLRAGSPNLTLLHTAVFHKRMNAAIWLLDKDHEICNLTDDEGRTPLHIAVQLKQINMAKLLLEKKADHKLAMKASAGNANITALQLAAENGDNDMVRLLMKYGARPDVEKKQLVNTSKLTPHLQIAFALLEEYIPDRKKAGKYKNYPQLLSFVEAISMKKLQPAYTGDDKVEAAEKLIENIINNHNDPVAGLADKEFNALNEQDSLARKFVQPLLEAHTRLTNRASPNHSAKTSPKRSMTPD
jgi:ankyrin repeat protein